MAEFKYEVTEEIGTISANGDWETKVRMVSWNGREPKFDIRSWKSDDSRMGKGISLTKAEAESLVSVLTAYLGGTISDEDAYDDEEPLTREEMLAEMREQEGY